MHTQHLQEEKQPWQPCPTCSTSGIPIARDGCKCPDLFGSTWAKSSDSPRRTLCPPGLMQRCPCETRCTAGTAMKARAQAGRATPALPASTRPGTWIESVSVAAQGGMGGYWWVWKPAYSNNRQVTPRKIVVTLFWPLHLPSCCNSGKLKILYFLKITFPYKEELKLPSNHHREGSWSTSLWQDGGQPWNNLTKTRSLLWPRSPPQPTPLLERREVIPTITSLDTCWHADEEIHSSAFPDPQPDPSSPLLKAAPNASTPH